MAGKNETTNTYPTGDKPEQETTQVNKSSESCSTIDTLLLKLIEQELSNNNEIVKQLLLQRLSANNAAYTRTPKPLNITEVGGYYNLLSDAFGEDKSMSKQMLASALGIPYMP